MKLKLPPEYPPVPNDVDKPRKCPDCGNIVAGPHTLGRSFMAIFRGLYRCAACRTEFAIKWHINAPNAVVTCETYFPFRRKKRAPCTPPYLLPDSAPQEYP